MTTLPRGRAYWVVDPGNTSDEPSITAYAIEDGGYVEAAASRGDEPLTVDSPYPVRIVPSDLVT